MSGDGDPERVAVRRLRVYRFGSPGSTGGSGSPVAEYRTPPAFPPRHWFDNPSHDDDLRVLANVLRAVRSP